MTGGLFIGVFNQLKAKVWHNLTIKVGVIVAEDSNEGWIENLLDYLYGRQWLAFVAIHGSTKLRTFLTLMFACYHFRRHLLIP